MPPFDTCKSTRYCRGETSCDIAIVLEDRIVDLSNLIPTSSSSNSKTNSIRKSSLSKKTIPRVRRNLYPSRRTIKQVHLESSSGSCGNDKQSQRKARALPRTAPPSLRRRKHSSVTDRDTGGALTRLESEGETPPPAARARFSRTLSADGGESASYSSLSSLSDTLDVQSMTSRESHPRNQIEIAPGIFAPLRGSLETLRALQRGDCITVMCMCCSAKLTCLSDAEYVLCPDCRVISPIELPGKTEIGGVGLGVRAS